MNAVQKRKSLTIPKLIKPNKNNKVAASQKDNLIIINLKKI